MVAKYIGVWHLTRNGYCTNSF